MCGRFAITLAPDAMRSLFTYEDRPDFPPRYNIAPAQPIPIVHAEREVHTIRRRFLLARWGFIPGYVKSPTDVPLLFNARSEGLEEKASFRAALRRRRCLVPADAFYQWRRIGDMACPYLCRRVDGGTMAFAGLWETWCGSDGSEIDTACIVTTGANGVSATIHPRLPALIDRRDFATWLDPDESGTQRALALLRPVDNDVLHFIPISTAVNNAVNEGPQVQAVDPTRPIIATDERSSLL